MDIGMFDLVKDYAGIMVGLVLLLVAVSVLPGRAKWYVLTAGLAILGYEAYLRYSNRKLLQEADAERERLRGELGQLDGKRKELEQTVSGLHQQLVELTAKKAELGTQRTSLEQAGGDIAAQKQALDLEAEKFARESNELLQKVNSSESILARLKKADESVQQVDKVTR
jgi:chromosome segregation ATPase